jgi:hypothetical protein
MSGHSQETSGVRRRSKKKKRAGQDHSYLVVIDTAGDDRYQRLMQIENCSWAIVRDKKVTDRRTRQTRGHCYLMRAMPELRMIDGRNRGRASMYV